MGVESATARPADELVRTLSREGGIAVRVLVATRLVGEAVRRHRTSPTASVALGRALMGAVLLASGAKHEGSVQIQFRCDGPLGTILAISDARGRVRGYVANPTAEPRPGRIDVAAGVGRGVLAVVRERPGREPYTGLVPIPRGTVAQDLAHYLAESEQQRSAVALGVFVSPGGVEAAGGFLVEALPGCDEAEIERAEANVHGFPGPGELVRAGQGADAIADRLLDGLGSRERVRTRPAFHCHCGRERALRAASLLGREELARTARAAEPLDIHCRFCAESYTVSPGEIEALLGSA